MPPATPEFANIFCPASVRYVCGLYQPYEDEPVPYTKPEELCQLFGFQREQKRPMAVHFMHRHEGEEGAEGCVQIVDFVAVVRRNTDAEATERQQTSEILSEGGSAHSDEPAGGEQKDSPGGEKSNRTSAATLSNSLVFKWCDGSTGTIEQMLSWPFESLVDLSNAEQAERDRMIGKDRIERERARRRAAGNGLRALSSWFL